MKKQSLNENIERYNPTIDFGLTDTQVARRLECSLVNNVNKKYSKSYLNIFVNNICTFFNLLGLICFIALLLTKAPFSNFFFVFFYLTNISIGIIQEIRAKHCIDKLSLIASKTITVIRNGKQEEILSQQIVLDDIILLGMGD